MTDREREKVFDAIRNCVTDPKCKDCPWEDCEKIGCKRVNVPVTLLLDTLKLLKEQPEQKFFVDSDGKITPLLVQKHGHWIVSGEPPLMIKTCSECDVRFFHHPTGKLERFCANCGAKMDEEVKQE